MRCGLWLAAPDSTVLRTEAQRLLEAQDIPLAGFTDEASPLFSGCEGRAGFLYRISEAVMRGDAVPAELIIRHLSRDALPGNVVRRYLEWQQNLRLYLAAVDQPVPGEGYFLLGDNLLCCPLNGDGAAYAVLPAGVWTDIITGETTSGCFRRLRSPNAMPIMAREGALIPTGDEACPTLHWYQPPENAPQHGLNGPHHLILHRDGDETCLR